MRDLPTFIRGLHDYIRLALAPLIKRLDALEQAERALVPVYVESLKDIGDRVKALEDKPAPQPLTADVELDYEKVVETIKAELDQRDVHIQSEVEKSYGWVLELGGASQIVTPERAKSIAEEVLAAIAPPEKGDKGEDGKSITLDDVRPMMEFALELTLAKLALEVERRNTDRMQAWEANANATLQRAIDNIPKPKDALSVTDFSAKLLEDGRTLRVSLGDGEREKYADVRLGHVLDAGPWMPGKTYGPGDGVTCMGSYWIAKEQTDEQPTGESTAWRRAVSKGRDARRVELPKQPSQPVRLTERD